VSQWKALRGQTPIDISHLKAHLKAKGVRTQSELDSAEAENVRKAVSKYFGRRSPTHRMAPFTLKWVKRLHRQMFGDVWEWAGRNRWSEVNIGVKWYLIDERLQHLLDDLACWERSGIEILEQAVMLHHRAVQIHPFYNGNGRWARMLSNILLRLRGHRETVWPENLLGTESTIRDEYINAILAADQGECELLLSLHRRYTPTPRPPGRIMIVRRPSTAPRPGKVTLPRLIPPPDEE